jgi:hypothetical protein
MSNVTVSPPLTNKGLPGPSGTDGRDGLNGRDGVDGAPGTPRVVRVEGVDQPDKTAVDFRGFQHAETADAHVITAPVVGPGGGSAGALTASQLRAMFGDYPVASTRSGVGDAYISDGVKTAINSQIFIPLPYGAGTYVRQWGIYLEKPAYVGGDAANPIIETPPYKTLGTFDNIPPNSVYIKAKIETANGFRAVTFNGGADHARLDPASPFIYDDPMVISSSDLMIHPNTGESGVWEHSFQYVDNTLPAASDGNRYLVFLDSVFTNTPIGVGQTGGPAESASSSNGETDKTAIHMSASTASDAFWSLAWRMLDWPGSAAEDVRQRIPWPTVIIGDSRTYEPKKHIQFFLRGQGIPFTPLGRDVETLIDWRSPAGGGQRHRRFRGQKIAYHEFLINDITVIQNLAQAQALLREDFADIVSRGVTRIIRECLYPSTSPAAGFTTANAWQSLAGQGQEIHNRAVNEHIRRAMNLYFKDFQQGPAAWCPVDYYALDPLTFMAVSDTVALLRADMATPVTVSGVSSTSITLTDASNVPDPAKLTASYTSPTTGIKTNPVAPAGFPYFSSAGTIGWAVVIGGQTYVYTAKNAATNVLTIPDGTAGITTGTAVLMPYEKHTPATPQYTDDGLHWNDTGNAHAAVVYVSQGVAELFRA